MPRSAALKPEQVPAESKPTLDAFTKNIGFTPNMLVTFAQSSIAFNAWAALLGSLSKALDAKTRDSIGLAVSEVNGCDYCLTVHSFTAEHMAKLPADESCSLGRAMPASRSGTPPSSLRAKSLRPAAKSVKPI
jgi:AhpD family alkylhydroperoxidase